MFLRVLVLALLLGLLPRLGTAEEPIVRRTGGVTECIASLQYGAPADERGGDVVPVVYDHSRRPPPTSMQPSLEREIAGLLARETPDLALCREHLARAVAHQHIRWSIGFGALAGLGMTSIVTGVSVGQAGGLNAIWGGLSPLIVRHWEWRGVLRALRRHRDEGVPLLEVLMPEINRAKARGAGVALVASLVSAIPSTVPGIVIPGFPRAISMGVLGGHLVVSLIHGIGVVAFLDTARRQDANPQHLVRGVPPVTPFAVGDPQGNWVFGVSARF